MRFHLIRSRRDLEDMIQHVGILPFFSNSVPGWSVEENADRSVWFNGQEGPWEWKGQLAFEKKCVYGKFIRGKAAWVSLSWFPDLSNWRRDGYDFDARVDDGLVQRRDRLLMEYVSAHPCALSREAKRGCGFTEGYDGVLTRLQMQTYLIDQDFRYDVGKNGRPYGWGNAALITPEDWLGEDTLAVPEGRTPGESFERIVRHLLTIMPDADEKALRRELK